MKTPITKRELKSKIKMKYVKTPRKERTAYSKLNSAELLKLAERIGAVPLNRYRVQNRSVSHLKPIQPGQVLRKRQKAPARPKMNVSIGINDRAKRGRVITDKKKWAQSKRYYDFAGIDDKITVKQLKAIAKRRGIPRYSTMRKKQLINAIAKTERVGR